MTKLPKLQWFLCSLVTCNPETPSEERVQDPEPPPLVAQRVTATVKREAAWLVHVQTEHEALVTTPEHPFATPSSRWIPAGRLAPGDRVVSARFGTVRVVSIQQAKRSHPQAVFNLTVDPSHTYVVGTDQVLVHNKECKDPAERNEKIEEAERELQDLNRRLASSAEDEAALKQQIAEVKERIAKLKQQARNARAYQKRKARPAAEPDRPGPEVAPATEAPGIARTTRAIEAVERKIEAIEGTGTDSSQQLAELKRERKRLLAVRSAQRVNDKKKRGIARVPIRERLLKGAEADYSSRRQELEAAQRELSAVLGERPQSDTEKKSHAERRAALEEKLDYLKSAQDTSKEILAGERRIAELAGRSPSTDAERQKIAAEQRDLTSMLSKLRRGWRGRDDYRRTRGDPGAYEKLLRDKREARRKRLRTADYVADAERPRDTRELLEEELAARHQAAGSERREERTEYLTERIETLEALAELSRESERIQKKLGAERLRRGGRIRAGLDTKEIEREIARLGREQTASRTRRVQLRLREALLGKLDGAMWTDTPGAMDEARVRELERELGRELAAGGSLPEERVRAIQDELGESELIDAEFLEEIWRESEAEEAALQETVQDEAEDVDAALRALAESLEKSPSPERTAAVESGLQALQNELREERSAVEAADFELANEHAFLSQTQGAPGSSHYAAGAQRLAEVQQQRMQLRIDWRERMRRRLDAGRQELRTLQSREARDGLAEADLARRIALLEHEVNNPSF